ncbi:hypothetical protein BH11MYX2_BH11MYX2_40020 [soil metagenome]
MARDHVKVGWEAEKSPALFPSMSAELTLSPLTAGETQLVLEGEYRAPLGVLGRAADAIVGHRLAEAAVHRLLHDIAEQLRRDLLPQE